MATDRWARTWKLHQDTKDIFKGIKDRQFRLKLIGTIGDTNIYDMDYERESDAEDPFAQTRFFQFGKTFPKPPDSPLREWNMGIDPLYKELIDTTFDKPSADLARLHGEKTVGGVKETLSLLLIPEANLAQVSGNLEIADLIYAICATKTAVTPPSPPASTAAALAFLQDGTAHGNPK